MSHSAGRGGAAIVFFGAGQGGAPPLPRRAGPRGAGRPSLPDVPIRPCTRYQCTRCTNKTKTKSAMLPTSLMSFFYFGVGSRDVNASKKLDRFSAPLPMGSGAGLQWSKKRGIFLSSLPQLKIGFGWGSMALNWITAHLRKPHALSNLWVTHSLLS